MKIELEIEFQNMEYGKFMFVFSRGGQLMAHVIVQMWHAFYKNKS